MQIQWKVVLLVAVAVACTVTALTWRASSLIYEDKSGFINDASEKQIAPVRRLVRSKLETAREQLVAFARAKERGLNPSFGDFDVVALSFGGDSKNWTAKWVEKRGEIAKSSRWAQNRDQILTRSMPFSKVRDGEMYWVWRLDKKEGVIYAVMVSVQVDAPASAASGGLPDAPTTANAGGSRRGVVVGFFSDNPLAAVTEDYIGSMHTVFVVDDQGYVASHSSKTYNGTRFTEDDIVKQIRESKRMKGSGTYEDLEGQKIAGRWEKVERTNLYAVITSPAGAATSVARRAIGSMVMWGLFLGLGSAAAAFLIGSRLSGSVRDLQRFVKEWQAGNFQPGILKTGSDEFGELAKLMGQLDGKLPVSQDTKPVETKAADPAPSRAAAASAPSANAPAAFTESAYRQMAMGLASSLRAPVAGILGNLQLLRQKAGTPEGENHADSIERDARGLKAILDSLARVAGDEDIRLKPTDPSEIVELALASLDRDFKSNDIKLSIDIVETPEINASPLHLQTAVEALCRQAIESLKTRSHKELRLRLYPSSEGKVRLVIADSGIGMDREVVDRYFEPFYQVYEGGTNPGLGLAMARALFERHLGEITVDSTPGQGTMITVELPPSSQQRAKPAPAMKPFAAPQPQTPMTPPAPITSASQLANAAQAPLKPTKPAPTEPRAFPAAPPVPMPVAAYPEVTEAAVPGLFDDVVAGSPSEPEIKMLADEPVPPLDLSRTAPPSEEEIEGLEFPTMPKMPSLEETMVISSENTSAAVDLGGSDEFGDNAHDNDQAARHPYEETSLGDISLGDVSMGEVAMDESPYPEVSLGDVPLETESEPDGPRVFDLEVPSSFESGIEDDEPEPFSAIGLRSAVSPVNEDDDGVTRFIEPEPMPNDETFTLPLVEPASLETDGPISYSEPPQETATMPILESNRDDGRSPANAQPSGDFRVKIRRPTKKG